MTNPQLLTMVTKNEWGNFCTTLFSLRRSVRRWNGVGTCHVLLSIFSPGFTFGSSYTLICPYSVLEDKLQCPLYQPNQNPVYELYHSLQGSYVVEDHMYIVVLVH